MKNNPTNKKPQSAREKLLWSVLIPQFILLTISIVWINISPEDNVFKYFTLNFKFLFMGIATGATLAAAGYVFYLFAKKTKKLYATVELFEQMLAPAYKNFYITDLIALSFISSFCEEVFFRGLVLPTFGIVLSSIAFGMLHLPGIKFWIYAVWATASGFILGGLFIMSNSLWVPITAHAINNIIGMILLTKLNSKAGKK